MKLVRRILSSINQSSWFWGFGSFEALTSVRVEFGIIIIVQHRIIFIRVARHFFLKNFFDFPRMNSVTNCCSWLALIELRKLISWNHRTIGLCLESSNFTLRRQAERSALVEICIEICFELTIIDKMNWDLHFCLSHLRLRAFLDIFATFATCDPTATTCYCLFLRQNWSKS